jgi:hypothetical protein
MFIRKLTEKERFSQLYKVQIYAKIFHGHVRYVFREQNQMTGEEMFSSIFNKKNTSVSRPRTSNGTLARL